MWKMIMAATGALGLASCSPEPVDSRSLDASFTAVTSSEPVRRFWVTANASSNTWVGGQPDGKTDLLGGKSGRYAMQPHGMVLQDSKGAWIGEVLGFKLNQPPGTTGRGHLKTGFAFTWTAQ